jgi:hypothetical protein
MASFLCWSRTCFISCRIKFTSRTSSDVLPCQLLTQFMYGINSVAKSFCCHQNVPSLPILPINIIYSSCSSASLLVFECDHNACTALKTKQPTGCIRKISFQVSSAIKPKILLLASLFLIFTYRFDSLRCSCNCTCYLH